MYNILLFQIYFVPWDVRLIWNTYKDAVESLCEVMRSSLCSLVRWCWLSKVRMMKWQYILLHILGLIWFSLATWEHEIWIGILCLTEMKPVCSRAQRSWETIVPSSHLLMDRFSLFSLQHVKQISLAFSHYICLFVSCVNPFAWYHFTKTLISGLHCQH